MQAQEAHPEAGAPVTGEGGVLPHFSRSQVTPRTVVVVIFTTLLLLGGLYLLWQLRQIVRWCVIALFLAVALDPAVNWVNRRRVPRGLAIFIVYLVLLLLLVGMAALVLPPLIDQVQGLGDYLVTLFRRPGGLNQALEDLAASYGLAGYLDVIRAQLSSLPARLTSAAGPLLVVTRGVVGSVTAFISILLLTFFLLLDGARFAEAGVRLFAAPQQPRLRRLLAESARAVSGYITGNLVISLIAGVAAFVALTILRMPYAVALALVIALFDLIPLVGATLGAAIVVIVGLFVEPVKGAALAAYFLVYQQIENNVLQPLVYGRSVQLHPLAVFLAVLAGGELLGILGALLAIPVAEIIRILGAEWLASRARQTGGEAHGTEEATPIDQVVADAAT
jgi:predicted PurR-regulated permease PerM